MIYKINYKYYFLLLVAFSMTHPARAQDNTETKPLTVKTLKQYRSIARKDGRKRMTELRSLSPTIIYDLRYATSNNFVKQAVYPPGTVYTMMRAPAAEALAKVQSQLATEGLGLKIFDAYRPFSVTVKFWDLVKDERYVARPTKGSGHNRGLAVDLTLVELTTGKELDMGTGFDNFTDTASPSFKTLPPTVLVNRKKLQDVMNAHGFKVLETEWWHFHWPNNRDYEVLDIPVAELVAGSEMND